MTKSFVEDEQDSYQQQQQTECEDDKHFWVHNSFCDKCEKDFDDWLKEQRRKVAFEILAVDLKQMLDEMWKERRINRDDANHLMVRMIRLAKDRRDYL